MLLAEEFKELEFFSQFPNGNLGYSWSKFENSLVKNSEVGQ